MNRSFSLMLLFVATSAFAQAPDTNQTTDHPQPGRIIGIIKNSIVIDVTETPKSLATTQEDAEGIARLEEFRIRKVVMIPISNVRFTTPSGTELDPNKLIVNAPTLICRTETLPALWQDLLSDNVCVAFAVGQTAKPSEPPKPPVDSLAMPASSGPVFVNLGNGVGVSSGSIDEYASEHDISRESARQQLRMAIERRRRTLSE